MAVYNKGHVCIRVGVYSGRDSTIPVQIEERDFLPFLSVYLRLHEVTICAFEPISIYGIICQVICEK